MSAVHLGEREKNILKYYIEVTSVELRPFELKIIKTNILLKFEFILVLATYFLKSGKKVHLN